MIRFINGPASGVQLTLQRAPMFLRVVHSGISTEEFDALDQLDDTPQPDEFVWVYIMKGQPGYAHVDGRDKKTGKRFGRTYPIAEYELFHSQPADDIVRDNTKWGEWTTETTTEIF